MESLKIMDSWFINLVAFCGAGYFLWSVKKILEDLKDELRQLKELIDKVFSKADNHEQRISRIEGIVGHRRLGEDNDL
jgi:hypothetical protein